MSYCGDSHARSEHDLFPDLDNPVVDKVTVHIYIAALSQGNMGSIAEVKGRLDPGFCFFSKDFIHKLRPLFRFIRSRIIKCFHTFLSCQPLLGKALTFICKKLSLEDPLSHSHDFSLPSSLTVRSFSHLYFP